ncbi:MAG: undecaprenyldiphospho-muramoylpentapeptide beta-N-acetylglucosaminyltransferase [Burkholderiales bacterium]|nr:MAG: undecaprenyldiphospho-muramoylpentapeptide beta-N-acetylglucosaminyltransferase [Burkholderiales bacterium]
MTGPTVLVMAGGTGGHVFPGLAVAEALRARGWQVVWLGNRGGMEAELVPRHDIPMLWIDFGGLRGKGLLARLLLPVRLLRAFAQSIGVLRRVRPAVVLGLGGYVSFPAGMMAVLLGRPLVVHEQNSVAGLANRVLARVADRTLAAFPDVLPRAQWVGNPLRRALRDVPGPESRYGERSGPLQLLVVGGSLGARALNELVPAALALIAIERRPQVTHQSGRSHRDALEQRYRDAGVGARVVEFIDDMASAYADADLVVCRAGAMTVAELAAVGVASILVPFPHAVDDHQTGNARFLAAHGAALLEPQAQLTPQRLARLIEGLRREALLAMAVRARELARPDAAERVADACTELAAA